MFTNGHFDASYLFRLLSIFLGTENILHEISKTQTIELQNVDEHQMQVIQQDEYLHQYGLYRAHIQGDGNCLFRSVSFGLYGTEDHHYALRELAVNHIDPGKLR